MNRQLPLAALIGVIDAHSFAVMCMLDTWQRATYEKPVTSQESCLADTVTM